MENYKKAGVDIFAGDQASKIAFSLAKKTFPSRKNLIGEPFSADGGFAGMLDFGNFFLAQCCDTVGTKIDLCEKLNYFEELGKDLLAMVCDDAICLGAETVAITNTFETKKIDQRKIEKMMTSLSKICQKQKIIISGGEIAEVGEKINGTSWGADAIAICEKNKILRKENVCVGDKIISLQEKGFRCNGFSLIRKILQKNWNEDLAKKCLLGSQVFSAAILKILGRFGEKPKGEISAIAHITGGGIPGNLCRILPSGHGANLEDIFPPSNFVVEIAKLGKIPAKEFYEVFNGGNGMMIISPENSVEKILEILHIEKINAKICGRIIKEPKITISLNSDLTEILNTKEEKLEWKI